MSRTKSSNDKIKFLSQPGNLDIAFDVYETFPGLLKELLTRFWEQVGNIIRETISKSPDDFRGWMYHQDDGSPLTKYFAVGLRQANVESKEYCYPCLGQKWENNKFMLRYGIYLAGPQKTRDPHKRELLQFRELESALQRFDRQEWWIGFIWLDQSSHWLKGLGGSSG